MDRLLRDGAFAGETHIVTGAGSGDRARDRARGSPRTARRWCWSTSTRASSRSASNEIAAEGAPRPITAAIDVTNESAVQETVRRALDATGCINGVVNVAGIARDARIIKKSYDEFKAVVAVHLYGTFLFMREVAVQHWHPLFKDNGNQPLADGVNRFIINFSSVSRAQRQHRADRLHRGEGRDRVRHQDRRARVRELPRARERDRAGAREHADAGRGGGGRDRGDVARHAHRAGSPSPRRSPRRSPRSPTRSCSATRPVRCSPRTAACIWTE